MHRIVYFTWELMISYDQRNQAQFPAPSLKHNGELAQEQKFACEPLEARGYIWEMLDHLDSNKTKLVLILYFVFFYDVVPHKPWATGNNNCMMNAAPCSIHCYAISPQWVCTGSDCGKYVYIFVIELFKFYILVWSKVNPTNCLFNRLRIYVFGFVVLGFRA